MSRIELRPHTEGQPISGIWDDRNILYLTGQGGELCWSCETQEGTLIFAVAFLSHHAVRVASVHPLCHVDGDRNVVRLGMETFDIHSVHPKWCRPVRVAVLAAAAVLFVACGWWLHSLAKSPSPVATPLQEEGYVF